MVEALPEPEGKPPVLSDSMPKANRSRPRWWLLALLVFLLGGGLWSWTWLSRQQDRRNWLRMAQQGRFAEAEGRLKDLLQHDAHDVAVLRALAVGQMQTGSMTEAESYLNTWCTIRPADAEPFKRRMELRRRLSRDPEALADGLQALQAAPEDFEVRREVCKLLIWEGKLDDAETHCRRCLQIAPGDEESLCYFAQILHDRGNNTEAAVQLDSLLGKSPDFAPALLLRAILYQEADQSTRAIPLLERVITLDNGVTEVAARYQLGLAMTRTGRTSEGKRMIAEVQQERLAEVFVVAGKTDDAIRLLEGIVKENSQFGSARMLLAQCYEKRAHAVAGTRQR